MSAARSALLGAALLLPAAAAAFDVEVLQSNGPPSRRIDLVVLGDGYRAEDQAKLSTDAAAVIDGLFGLTPYLGYRGLFNVKLVHVVSRQDGADHGTLGGLRDTALGAEFNCLGLSYLLCVDNQVVVSTAIAHAPEYDVLIVVVNDALYGGSGGDVAVASMHRDSVNLLRHELSHTLGNLADEYEDPWSYPPCSATADCPEPNATVRSTREGAKWAAWIDAATPVPTPEGAGRTDVGLYEGCRYQPAGVFRAREDGCLMRRFTPAASFCPVCAEGLVTAFWRRAPLLETVDPPAGAELSSCAPHTFTITHPPAAEARWLDAWTVGGELVAGDTQTVTLPADPLRAGRHPVEVLTQDRTALVRSDPQGLLSERAAWTLVGCAPGPCHQSAACVEGACVGSPLPPGTACAACVAGVEYRDATCDAGGTCVPQATVACSPYACAASAPACRTSCEEDGHCAAGFVCRAGACVSPPPPAPEPPAGCGCGAGGAGPALLAAQLLALAGRRTRIQSRRSQGRSSGASTR